MVLCNLQVLSLNQRTLEPMRLFFSFALIGLFTSLSAQEVTYPYNPDANNDQYVAVSDVLSTISAFGSEFLPTEIQIDGVGLAEVIGQLQASISALEAENSAQSVLITELQNSSGGGIEGLDTYLSVDESTNTVLISGANLQVVSGGGYTEAPVNGTGNVIIGYDEVDTNDGIGKTGSHNLVMGRKNSYTSHSGIVAGSHNRISDRYASILGGYHNANSGILSVTVGGNYNTISAQNSVFLGGGGMTFTGFEKTHIGRAPSINYVDAFGDLRTIPYWP